MTSALILAAGRGRRMGGNKALLKWQGQSFLSLICQNLRAGHVNEIVVVTGAEGDRVGAEAWMLGARVVHNSEFDLGMMSSLQKGLRSLDLSATHALVTLVDLPLIQSDTFQAVIESRGGLVRPTFNGEPGHPCLIGREYFDEILSEPMTDRGASFLFNRHSGLARTIAVNDSSILKDFDFANDLEVKDVHAALS